MKDKQFTVQSDDTLLTFLRSVLPGEGRNFIKGLLGRGQVHVNGQPVRRHDHPLHPGQLVTIAAAAKTPPPFPVLYEDDALLVCNKPPGLLAAPTERESEQTALRLLSAWLEESRSRERLYLTHRLDRDTSGLLLFCKDAALRERLQENWTGYVSHRGYYALVEGVPEPPKGVLRDHLRETKQFKVYVAADGEGREAVTDYEVWKQGKGLSILRLSLHTGRKNQIRAQLEALGHPVLGDRKYGSKTGGRLWLHAYKLCLTHPASGEKMCWETPPPRGMLAILKKGVDAL